MKNLLLNSYQYRQAEQNFKQWLMTVGYAESSVYNLPTHVREFFHFLEQQEINHLQQISTTQVQQFFDYLTERSNQRRSGSLSTAHLNKYLQALKLLSKYLSLTGQAHIGIEIKRLKTQRQIKDILSREEVEALYECCDYTAVGLRDRAMLSLYYGCGLRRSEGTSLEVGDVMLKKRLLYVRKGKNYKERYVPLNTSIIEDLQTYLYEARPLLQGSQYITDWHPQEALLLSEKGRKAESQTLALRLKVLQQRAGIDKTITLHLLRHSIATHLLQSGMQLQHIADFLGHQSLEATQIYTHIAHEPHP